MLQLMDATADKETQKFHALVAAMISSQTRDAVTSAAMQRLQRVPGGLSVANIATDEVSMDTLAEILKPVGFYRYTSPSSFHLSIDYSFCIIYLSFSF